MKKLLVICITALFAGCHTNVDLEQQVDELYAKMSQEERIAQLRSMYMDELFDEQGKLDTAKCRQLIPYGIGHFSQFCMQQPREPQVLRDRAIAIQDWLMNNTPMVSRLSCTRRCSRVSTRLVLPSIPSRSDRLDRSIPNWRN